MPVQFRVQLCYPQNQSSWGGSDIQEGWISKREGHATCSVQNEVLWALKKPFIMICFILIILWIYIDQYKQIFQRALSCFNWDNSNYCWPQAFLCLFPQCTQGYYCSIIRTIVFHWKKSLLICDLYWGAFMMYLWTQ